jgi:predicted GNAT family acetyltransferase
MDIKHDADSGRFSTTVDGLEAEVGYDLEGGILSVTHTSVPSQIGGRGIAGDLNRAAFDFARAQGLRVRPVCSYAAAWSQRHPEYADLIA